MKGLNLILQNGKIWTAEDRQIWAQALAIRADTIVAVGSNNQVLALGGKDTQVIDLGGRLVLPGFNDTHTHYLSTIIEDACSLDLFGVKTQVELQSRLKKFAVEHPEQTWLWGHRWDSARYGDGSFPTTADLDAVVSLRPVAITDIDGHSTWVNQKALEVMGIQAGIDDPAGGKIVRAENGQPTGMLLEEAGACVPEPHLPPEVDFSAVLTQGIDRLNRLGITSLSNYGVDPGHFDTILELAAHEQLNLRISEWLTLQPDLSSALETRRRLLGNEKIRLGGLKTFMDGVLSTWTAWMIEPYADNPGNCGFSMHDPLEMADWVEQADRHGFQVITHAIGDMAVRKTLYLYQSAAEKNGKRDARHRIEHIEVIHPSDLKRFVEFGIIPGMQPLHGTACIDDYVAARLGNDRCYYAYAWKSLSDTGARLCFGTDWPAIDMAKPNPLENIFGAVTRIHPSSSIQAPWHVEQSISLAQAVNCYTYAAAYAEFMEARKGLLQPEMLADICVLDRDIFVEPPSSLLESRVVLTIFDGRVVFRDF